MKREREEGSGGAAYYKIRRRRKKDGVAKGRKRHGDKRVSWEIEEGVSDATYNHSF